MLNVFREGDVFGEIALLDGRPRTADATAMADCELVVIERRDFVPFLSSNPEQMLNSIAFLLRDHRKPAVSHSDSGNLKVMQSAAGR